MIDNLKSRQEKCVSIPCNLLSNTCTSNTPDFHPEHIGTLTGSMMPFFRINSSFPRDRRPVRLLIYGSLWQGKLTGMCNFLSVVRAYFSASQASLFIFGIFWQWKLTCRFNGCEEMLIPTIHFILYSPFIRQKIDLMCQNTFLLAKHKAIFCVNCITSRTENKHMVTKRKHSTHRQPSHLNWWKLTHSNTSYEMEVKVITCICLHHRTSVGCSVKEPAYLVWEKT